jgi:hypothetical protein
MTCRTLAVTALLVSPFTAFAEPPTPAPAIKSPASKLVELLGSDDFAEREAASKRLADLGAAALDEVRAACASADPEVAMRARDLAARIGRRVENEKNLAPTLVELSSEDVMLDSVLADLSKQSGYQVVLGGLKVEELAAKKITVKTGKVAFWAAVKVINDAAGLQIASVGGFTAPGSLPYHYRSSLATPNGDRVRQLGADRPPPPGGGPIAKPLEDFKRNAFAVRTAPLPNEAVVLEARDAGKLRPWATFGAVCVEAFAVPVAPNGADNVWSLLQVWPEPKVAWRETRGVSVRRADDDQAQALRSTPTNNPGQVLTRGVRMANGNVMILNEAGFEPRSPFPTFQPNIRQHTVKFKAAEKPSASLAEFAGSVYGVIRSPLEAIAVAELEAGKQVQGAAHSGVTLKATLVRADARESLLEVDLSFPQQLVEFARVTDPLPGMTGPTNFSNNTVNGLRATDADGNPLTLVVQSITHRAPFGGQQALGFKMLARPPVGKPTGEPKAVTFWGTYGKTVEVPFTLSGAPLVVGKK